MTREQILTLARAYADHEGISLSTVGAIALKNNLIFRNLANGGDCLLSNAERAAQWFAQHWPDALAWPDTVPRPSETA